MKKCSVYLFVIVMLLAILPGNAFASGLTLQVPAEVVRGSQLEMSGSAAGSDVILSIKSATGEVLFFDTQKVASGSYSSRIIVPVAWPAGNYAVTVISGSSMVTKEVAVRLPSSPPIAPGGGGTPNSSPAQLAGNTVTIEAAGSMNNGRMTARISKEQISQAIELFNSEAGNNGTKVVEIKVNEEQGAELVAIHLPQEAAAMLLNGGVSIRLATGFGQLTFDPISVQSLVNGTTAEAEVRFQLEHVDKATLPPRALQTIGDRPVVDFTVYSGDRIISDFGRGTVQISVPYTLAQGEDPNAIAAYYVADNGQLTAVRNGRYIAAEGRLVFGVKHFSKYAVGYNKVVFTDVAGWSTDYITYLAARSIVDGVGNDRFAPTQTLTRAEMVALLAKMADADVSSYQGSQFADVQADAWYAGYIQWGYEHGIVEGTGDRKFNPVSPVSREELAVMISRYAHYVDYTLPQVNAAQTFADLDRISRWAISEIGEMQQAGIIEGVGNNRFNPKGSAKREEAAKMIAVLVQGMAE